jgi:hypothetical protein
MALRTLPLDASDDDIKALVVEWSELLAQKQFQTALEMFLHVERRRAWTPTLLEKTIAGYGVPDLDSKTLSMMLEEWGVERFEITSLFERPDKDELIEKRMKVDREHLFGLAPESYLGMVHYNDIPLCGYRSDLTARFNIKRVGNDHMTLELLDIHVM